MCFNINPCVLSIFTFAFFLKHPFPSPLFTFIPQVILFPTLCPKPHILKKKNRKYTHLYLKINLIVQLHFLTGICCCLGSKFCYINRYAMRSCLQIFEEMLCFLYATNTVSFIYSSSSFLFYIAFHSITQFMLFLF